MTDYIHVKPVLAAMSALNLALAIGTVGFYSLEAGLVFETGVWDCSNKGGSTMHGSQ